MLKFLPVGFLGVMIAGMLAAYVSTLSTHLNWGTSYLVHDFYRRFVRPGREERHYVAVGRLVTALLMVAAAFLTLVLDTARQTFDLLLSVGAGTGLIYLLRWFWWRINAWSEVAAMASSFVVAVGFFVARQAGHAVATHVSLVITIAVTTLVWLAATYLTKPTDRATLSRSTTRPSRRPRLALRSAPRPASPLLPTACRRPSSAGSSGASSSTRRSSAPAASSTAGPLWQPSGSSSSSPAAPASSASSPASGPAASRDGSSKAISLLPERCRTHPLQGSLQERRSLIGNESDYTILADDLENLSDLETKALAHISWYDDPKPGGNNGLCHTGSPRV